MTRPDLPYAVGAFLFGVLAMLLGFLMVSVIPMALEPSGYLVTDPHWALTIVVYGMPPFFFAITAMCWIIAGCLLMGKKI